MRVSTQDGEVKTSQASGIFTCSVVFGIGVMFISWHEYGPAVGIGAGIISALLFGIAIEWFYR